MGIPEQRKHLLSGCPTLVEVAVTYFSNCGQRTAMKRFKEYVNDNEAFSADLAAAGYTKWHSFFVPHQMIVVFEHMGSPDAAYEWMQGKFSRP